MMSVRHDMPDSIFHSQIPLSRLMPLNLVPSRTSKYRESRLNAHETNGSSALLVLEQVMVNPSSSRSAPTSMSTLWLVEASESL